MNNQSTVGLTIGEAMKDVAHALDGAGIENPRLEARILVGFAIGGGAEKVLAERDRIISDSEAVVLQKALCRRRENEPIAYITAMREFWSLPFKVTPATLIPRPDSETLIEAVLGHVDDKSTPLKILDLGTGSGCLLLALLSELKSAEGMGIDANIDTIEVAKENAKELGFAGRTKFVDCNWHDDDWTKKTGSGFDVILSNPPYITDEEMKSLDATVRDFEPTMALSGGKDGLDSYRRQIIVLDKLLKQNGMVAFEVGHNQAEDVAKMLTTTGLKVLEIKQDLSGIERAVLARKINP